MENLILNPVLSKLVVGNKLAAGIAHLICPTLQVNSITGKFIINNTEGVEILNDERAPRAEPGKINPDYVKTGEYRIKERALMAELDKTQEIEPAKQNGSNAILDLKKRTAFRLGKALDTGFEKRTADLYFNPDSYDANNKADLTANPINAESNPANPIEVFEAAKNQIEDSAGVSPNTLIIGVEVWRALKKHPVLLGMLANSERKQLDTKTIKEFLGFENIFVGKMVYKNKAGQSVKIWGKHASVCYVPKTLSADGEPVFAVNFAKTTGTKVQEYNGDPINFKMYAKRYNDIQVTAPKFAYFIQNIVA